MSNWNIRLVRQIRERKKKVIAILATVILVLGVVANITGILTFVGFNFADNEELSEESSRELDTIGKLGYSMGVVQYTKTIGALPNNSVRARFSESAVTYARKLNLYLDIEELNSSDHDQFNDIQERLVDGVYKNYGNRGKGFFEIRYHCAFTEFLLARSKRVDEQMAKIYILIAAGNMEMAANSAEKVGAKENIVLEAKVLGKEIFNTYDDFSIEKIYEIQLKVVGWEKKAIEAMYEIPL